MQRRDNPRNRFESSYVVFEPGSTPHAPLRVHEERVKTIVAQNKSPDLPFRYSINPYRGCQHACAYCYARPSHQYWGFGAGSDFERELIVKVNAVERLRALFEAGRWRGDSITFSGNTDCYQPIEGKFELTRRLLELCARFENPVAVITKSALVTRDIDVLQRLSRLRAARVFVSIPFADQGDARAVEPGTATIERRFEALSTLSAAGIETGVAVAPIIPGLNDAQIPQVLERARAAGARHAFKIALRLPAEVAPVFLSRLREQRPQQAGKVESALRQVRDGRLSESRFGERMVGRGPRWQAIDDLFNLHARRLGFDVEREEQQARPLRAPNRQLELFSASASRPGRMRPAGRGRSRP